MASKFHTASVTLAAAVANNGTFTVAYPSGTSQLTFTAGLADSGSYMIVNKNDQYTVAGSKFSISYDSSLITITNTTGASLAAGSTVDLFFDVKDGNDVVWLQFPIKLAKVTAADVVTEMRPCVEGVLEYVQFIVTDPVTTASKAATLNLEIDTTNVTGGTVALTSANCGTLGAVVAGAAITAANALTRESLLSVEAASVTAFVEGEGVLNVRIRRT